MEETGQPEASVPIDLHECPPFADKVLAYLRECAGPLTRATTGDGLAARLGLRKRDVQRAIEHLRQIHGEPIGGNSVTPYFLARSREELAGTLASMRSRIRKQWVTVEALERGLAYRFPAEEQRPLL